MAEIKPYEPHLNVSIEWIVERENIRKRKEAGKPPPWTDNELIANARWCNVKRWDDKVSQWLANNFYQNVDSVSPELVAVGAAMARLINRPETLEQLCPNGYKGFKYDKFRRILSKMSTNKEQIFTGVYIINGAGANGRRKWELVLDNLAAMEEKIKRKDVDTNCMKVTHSNLMKFSGLGSFIAGQVVADLRQVVKGQWGDAMVWAPQGPGSTKGLNYVFNTRGQSMNEKRFLELLPIYMESVRKDPRVKKIHKDRGLEAHDYQNCLCETSKMARLLEGGRAKNRYKAQPAQKELF